MSKDPIEREVAEALIDAGIPFTDDQQDTLGLDFFIPRFDLYIECKFGPTERILEQLGRAPDIIVIQGIGAAQAFRRMISTETVRES